jgi:hypothetical protein
MADAEPKSRPEPPPGPSIYGGQWGPGGEPSPEDTGKLDRPDTIKPPAEPQGQSSDGSGADSDGDF